MLEKSEQWKQQQQKVSKGKITIIAWLINPIFERKAEGRHRKKSITGQFSQKITMKLSIE